MAKPVIWSAEALHDIECIAEYISRKRGHIWSVPRCKEKV